MFQLKWGEIEEKSNRMKARTTHVLQEEVQKAILTSVSRNEAFNSIVLQGGTCLRLFYDNKRFSEDLDFILRAGCGTYDMKPYIGKVKDFILNHFPFFVNVSADVKVESNDFQKIVFMLKGEHRIQYVRIHMETAFVPSWDHVMEVLRFQVYTSLVRIETLEELLAEKIHALLSRSYLKGRDLWDIYYLFHEKNVSIPWSAVIKRSKAYGDIDSSLLQKQLLSRCKMLQKKGKKKLHDAMENFLLAPYYEVYSGKVGEIIRKIGKKLKELPSTSQLSQDEEKPRGQ